MKTRLRVVVLTCATAMLTTIGIAQQPQALRGQAPQQQQGAPAPSVWAAPPAPAAQASSAFQSACGNQPMCYDAPDFAVAVVDFRMSMASGYKLMDATLRFVNKTNQPLILGYLDGSAVALDDQGNRYAPYGNRNLAGIGIVNGNSGDPKFILQPGGAGDARWELLWRPGAQDPIGSAFELAMTIREINTIAGGQHTLGSEVPLRFQGLANGTTGAAGGAAPMAATGGVVGAAGASNVLANGGTASGLPPCGTGTNAAGAMTAVAGAAGSVNGQAGNTATNATNTASNAMSQLSSLKSIFGKKNAAAAPATNVAGATPCIPVANGAAMPVTAGTSTAPAAAGQVVGAKPATTAPTTADAAAAARANAAKTPATAATAKGAVPATAAPANAARTAAIPNAAAKPAVVNAAAPATRATAQPATAKKPATAAKPAPTPAPATQTPPPPK